MPSGNNEAIASFTSKLTVIGRNNIRNYVENGGDYFCHYPIIITILFLTLLGCYLGICQGAQYATKMQNPINMQEMAKFLAQLGITTEKESKNMKVPIQNNLDTLFLWQGQCRQLSSNQISILNKFIISLYNELL